MRRASWLMVTFMGSFVFLPNGLGQHGSTASGVALTSAQRAWGDYTAKRQSLQAQGKEILAAEMAREKAGDCRSASTTSDFDDCFGKQLEITDQALKSYEGVIRGLLVPPPGTTAGGADAQPRIGIAGPELTPAQFLAEFDRVEESWRQYDKTACTAAFHQFEGGTGGPSFGMQCELTLSRDHLRELHLMYGEDLDL